MTNEVINCLRNLCYEPWNLTYEEVAKAISLNEEDMEKFKKEFTNDKYRPIIANIILLMALSNYPYEIIAAINNYKIRNENTNKIECHKRFVKIFIYLNLISRFVPLTSYMVEMLQYNKKLVADSSKEKTYQYIPFIYFDILKNNNIEISYDEFLHEAYEYANELSSANLTEENKKVLLAVLEEVYEDLQNALKKANLGSYICEEEVGDIRRPNRRKLAVNKVKGHVTKGSRGKNIR